MTLPIAAIDRLFDRLTLTYGSEFKNKWAGLDVSDVKSNWAYELDVFGENLKAIGWALENLPDRCPNLIEFKSLCKQAPRPQTLKLDYSKADGEVVDAELAKIASEAFQTPKNERGHVDHKLWAKKLAQRHSDGEVLSHIQIKMYKAALEAKDDL